AELLGPDAHAWLASTVALLRVKSPEPEPQPITSRITTIPPRGLLTLSRAAPPALGGGRHSQEAGDHAALEQAVQDRAKDRLIEGSDVQQEREHREDRKRDGELHPRLQCLPPEDYRRRRRLGGARRLVHRRSMIFGALVDDDGPLVDEARGDLHRSQRRPSICG